MHRSISIHLAGVVTLAASPVLAQVPTYSDFELQVRSNLCVNEPQGFNLPCDHFFGSATPTMNDDGQVAVRLNVMGGTGTQGIWFGESGTGSIVYTSPFDALVSDPSINNNGYVVFPQTFSSQNGIYFYNSVTDTSGLRTTLPFGTTSWGSPTVNDSEQVGYRVNFSGSGQAHYSLDGASSLALHIAEVGLDPQSPVSFLFTPNFNNQRQIASKVRLGGPGQTGNSQPDQIRVYNDDGSSVLIAEDIDSNPMSPYSSFDNSVGFNDSGWVAFRATLPGNVFGVFLSDGVTTHTIARTDQAEVSVIDAFPPTLNNNGLVAFRGRDAIGRYAIFVGDGTTLRRVIGQFDQVMTDRGLAQLAQHDTSNVFGGSLAINASGDIAFHAGLTPHDNTQIEWGSGIIIARATPACPPVDINCDGSVGVPDLLAVINGWGQCPAPPDACPADIAPPGGDGAVGVPDLLMVINNWGPT